MNGRALVIGASVEGPPERSAEHHDVRRMTALLEGRGFVVEALEGLGATREGILAGYRRLIRGVTPGCAAVVYYSGHGGRVLDTEPGDPGAPRMFQCIIPTDYERTTEDDFHGISSWELSLLLAELTAATPNVTTIFDCCHAAQMSRGDAAAGAQPRARPKPTRISIRRHFDALRDRYGALGRASPGGNPRAVRLAACGEGESAFPTFDAERRPTGALTHALLATLAELGGAEASWQAIGAAVRDRVRKMFATQRPAIDGPVRRRPFSLDEIGAGAIPIGRRDDGFRLEAGQLAGVSVGDVYGVARVGAEGFDPARGLARARIIRVAALHAGARLEWLNEHAALPADAIAWPLERALDRQPVRIVAPEGELGRLEAAVAGSARLRVAADGERAIGELRRRDGKLAVLTEDGVSLRSRSGSWPLDHAIRQLQRLAAAQALRELRGEGLAAEEIDVEWGTLHDGAPIARPADGAAVSQGDRIFIRIHNRSAHVRHAHVFSIGLCGKITRLSRSCARGITLEPLAQALVDPPGDPSAGFKPSWPEGMPPDEPRADRLVVIVTAEPADLRALATDETGARGAARGGGTPLQRLLAQLHEGGTRSAGRIEQDPFLVVHRSWMLHPLAAPVALAGFAIDEDPRGMRGVSAREAWLGGGAPARELELRLRDVTAARAVRLDALVCTRSAGAAGTHAARTVRIAPGAPARDDGVLWRGPARDLVEIYLWAAPDPGGAPDLAELLAAARGAPGIGEAIDALVVADERAPWALAAGACAALANLAARRLRAVAPGAEGLVHASLVAADDHGLVRRTRYRAHGVELALAIAIEPPGPP